MWAATATAVESGPIDETATSVAWADMTPSPYIALQHFDGETGTFR